MAIQDHKPDVEAMVTLTRKGFNGYRPHFRIQDDYLTSGTINYINQELTEPGETAQATIRFMTPHVYPQSLWTGKMVEIAEGSHVVGEAQITRILNPVLARQTI